VDAAALASAVVDRVGKQIVLATPLGLGKAPHIVNALFDRAASDATISLRILTALTPEKPRPGSELHRRFVEPLTERLFEGYPDLRYAEALRRNDLPPNIRVSEFFFMPGRWLGVPAAQQQHISANYTHVARYLLRAGVNVLAQLVAPSDRPGDDRLSLSCNPDLTLDLLSARSAGEADFVFAGQVNDDLPFMAGDAAVSRSEFDYMLDSAECRHPLFTFPNEPVSPADATIGLHVARLVPDDGTLQIGIGSIGDAIAQALILRHRHDQEFRDVVGRLGVFAETDAPTETGPFEKGLYGASEMLVGGFLELIRAGVMKREVDGALVRAAFFLGSRSFHRALREMPPEDRDRIAMTAVSAVNELGDDRAKKHDRRAGRFVNNTMMVTLLGAAVSDGLEDGRVVSGVGGQYNFVAEAFELGDARSIIALNATRETGGKVVSNIRWSYGNTTIPRHLRDIVVTEYGIADLYGRTDAEVVAAMLNITDSRFQEELLDAAKQSGKVALDYEIPQARRHNTPERLAEALDISYKAGLLSTFPFGTDFTDEERRLLPALDILKSARGSRFRLAQAALRGARSSPPTTDEAACLDRMGLAHPSGIRERFYRALLRGALAASA